ncbi:hypothetical protein [Nostoc sp.]|uniref:hypothetical protein n=1 Tax=Nostoc sp. TaxID=1180 RepID=UPI002FFB6AEB
MSVPSKKTLFKSRSQQHSTSFTAIALSRKLVLLTGNHRDLGKVPGLLIEDWTV